MKRLFSVLFILACVISLALTQSVAKTFTIEGTLSSGDNQQDALNLSSNVQVTLNKGEYSAYVAKDGSFKIQNVPAGNWLLEVRDNTYLYPKLRVETGHTGAKGIKVHYYLPNSEWEYKGSIVPYPLKIVPFKKIDYFMVREGFSIASLFANPMMLMMGVSVVMMFLLPKMMDNIDPEALKEIQENQATSQNVLNDMPNISQTLANLMSPQQKPKKK
ncbi:hypothetical protein K493DRAFT_313391 [Basidiobolus meristosporus CBS 931.73]|uniref:ER membrane protein complex subunit 7 beta-sandwich domain-containing protein n=1 Tax=Basidiobolus meristosporus CBS 931.73 TaxID=1314790 RepID=A0A1Y1YLT6_9FUNG|nr:hypothetical protein K493DRAFT_313391 [Basidiobolus meristosporus CBS 931.73]|eukprot:ORX98970.1 hypothetical protein K493DRAFT_313391 [Basidiobolus meristosporus CBS 931.73]